MEEGKEKEIEEEEEEYDNDWDEKYMKNTLYSHTKEHDIENITSHQREREREEGEGEIILVGRR